MAIREVILTGEQLHQLEPMFRGFGKGKENINECGSQLTEDEDSQITVDGGDSLESTKQATEKAKSSGLKNFAVKTVFGEGKKNKKQSKLRESVTLTWKELLGGKI